MARTREVYSYDYATDFGLSGFAGALCARATLRLDEPVVLDLAESEAEDDDHQLGGDVRLLLDSPLPDEVLHTVWLAAGRRCFDPAEEGAAQQGAVERGTAEQGIAEHGTGTRGWLERVAELCPPRAPERDPYEAKSLDDARPVVPEGELRTAVVAEIESAAAGLELRVAVPGIVPALLRVVRQADADLGFRLFLRTLKAYSVPVDADTYERLLALGDRLAYPRAAVHDELTVRWRPLDPGLRDFASGRFGLPMLAAALHGSAWRYGGSPREHIQRIADDGQGRAPGAYAAVLLDDVWRLLDSALSKQAIGLLWRTAAGRLNVLDEDEDEFDADGRDWLDQISQVCHAHLAEVDPTYAPFLAPARTELTEAVLREVREAVHVGAGQVRGAARVLEDVVTAVDPDLGFRLLLQVLTTYEIPVGEARRDRYRALAAQLGFSEDHVDDRLPDDRRGVS
ncbi:hypothetical protein [Streptomyces sp. NBC_00572]|uniref:hypothetical protein n=1 Tax=Streptomyces sp. NBC_00572 TaxID=2903664 RepID=UPI0022501AFA|nr:hypothetical protein [Streptomyces sp. NBC_00572]MCX4984519.1 hypothetical protein [Streptomyces sp. NBC_00572]